MTYGVPLQLLTEKQEGDPSVWIAHFGGSFNPVHDAHIAIGRSLLDKYSFDRVVYVPNSRHYPKPGLAAEADRLALLQAAISGESRFEVCEYELGKGDWTEPFETIMYLKDRYMKGVENVRIFTVRGDDWLPEMMTWSDEIAEHEGLYEFIIHPRLKDSLQGVTASPKQINLACRMSHLMESQKPFGVSSTLVRELLKKGKICGLPVPSGVLDMIQKQGLYGVGSVKL